MAIVPLDLIRATIGVGVSVTDDTLEQVRDAAEGAIVPHLKVKDSAGVTINYANVPEVVEALLNASVEVYRYRKAPGGTFNAGDFTAQPYGLGRYFIDRWSGLLGNWINVQGLIG